MDKKDGKTQGRPSVFSQEIADRICELISTTSRGMRSICKEDGMPAPSTVYKWLLEIDSFSEQYARAKECQADFLAEEILAIADDSQNDTIENDETGAETANHEWISRSRLRVDSRKWLASKLAPKKYGDKLDIEANIKSLVKRDLSNLSEDELKLAEKLANRLGDQSGAEQA